MPIYEYVCDHCGKGFEWLVRAGQEPSCPACGRNRLTKQLSLPAAHVAGSSGPACPAKETGACGISDCGGNRCSLSPWR